MGNKVALILMVVFSLVSCRTKYIPIEMETKTIDSIFIIDTVVKYQPQKPNDSIQEATIRLDTLIIDNTILIKDTTSTLFNLYSTSTAAIKQGQLIHKLEVSNFELYVPLQHIHKKTIIEKPKPYIVEKPVPVEKELTRWQRFRLSLANITIIFLIITSGLFILRKIKLK